MTKGIPRLRHSAAMASTGWMKPKTLETWEQITASVWDVMAWAKAASTAPVEQGPGGHRRLRPQGRQGAGDGIVLVAGDHGPPPHRHQGLDGDVQCVGGVRR